ncbi:hypothetical protein AUG19_05260 [archaeon 13_1_20CM_2_54_9]|nr:MAG: hypothetical protein AUG19_05260 [archaeon 13_1_20CM_2_54_9]
MASGVTDRAARERFLPQAPRSRDRGWREFQKASAPDCRGWVAAGGAGAKAAWPRQPAVDMDSFGLLELPVNFVRLFNPFQQKVGFLIDCSHIGNINDYPCMGTLLFG